MQRKQETDVVNEIMRYIVSSVAILGGGVVMWFMLNGVTKPLFDWLVSL